MPIIGTLFLIIAAGLLLFSKQLPVFLRVFLRLLLPVWFITLAIQVFFYWYNQENIGLFSQDIFNTILRVLRISLFTSLISLLPFFCFFLAFSIKKNANWWTYFAQFFYVLGATSLVFINIADTVYFPFIHRHISIFEIDLLSRSGYLLWYYLQEMYWVLPSFALVVWFFYKIFNRVKIKENNDLNSSFSPFSVVFSTVFILIFTLIFLPNPLLIRYLQINTNENYWVYETNGAFTLLCSATTPLPHLSYKNYFSEEKCDSLFSPNLLFSNEKIDKKNAPKNIVLFFIESGAQEFFDEKNIDKPAMPFVDSLRRESWVFDNAFASSTSTDDGFMTVVGGIPFFMRISLPFSAYSGNKFEAFGHILEKNGYYNAFYYGVNNNRSGFGKYAKNLGVKNYFDLNNLHLQPHLQTIQHDYLFIPYIAKQKIGQQKQPFFTILFNTQTHTPFNFLPQNIAKNLPKGKIDADQAFSYFDFTLHQFFEAAKKQDWFQNTIFVFVGDHYSRSTQQKQQNALGKYRIPLWFYAPQKGVIRPHHSQNIAHQLDIAPTLLDLLQIKTPFYCFGNSLCDSATAKKIVYRHNDGFFWCLNNEFALQYDENADQPTAFYRWKNDSDLKYNLLKTAPKDSISCFLNYTRAVIQRFNKDMIDDKFY